MKKGVILSCRPCREKGQRFTAPHTPRGNTKMTAHFATEHPERQS